MPQETKVCAYPVRACVCVRACVRACACERARARACVRVRACVWVRAPRLQEDLEPLEGLGQPAQPDEGHRPARVAFSPSRLLSGGCV